MSDAPAAPAEPIEPAAPDTHLFRPGRRVLVASDGRRFARCATCGQTKRFAAHRQAARLAAGLDPRDPRVIRRESPQAGRAVPPPPDRPTVAKDSDPPAPIAIPNVAPLPWQLHLLDLALETTLRADIAYATRVLALDLQRAVRSELRAPATTRPAPVGAPAIDAHKPRRLRVVSDDEPLSPGSGAQLRRIARGIRSERVRALFLRAVESGWQWRLTGDGHLRVTGPAGLPLVLSTTGDRGRGYANAKAKAKRLGLAVDDL